MRRGQVSILFVLGAAATALAVGAAGRGATDESPVIQVAATADPVIAAVGDVACDPAHPSYNDGAGTQWECRQRYTSDLAVGAGLSGVLMLGDLQYQDGTLATFNLSYEPSWGRVKSITYPAPGNHEYHTPGAAGYYDYFGARAGDRTKGYYSFDIGAWHLIALNSECAQVGGCGEGSPQLTWLIQDLQAHSSAACTLAFWHHARFSSGGTHGNNAAYQPFWQALYDHDAELVLVGHDHDYERFAPQTPAGAADPTRGIRQFVVGTGGRSLRPFGTVVANSEVRESATFGILKLTLHPTSYDWEFVPEAGQTFTDTGSDTCHGDAPTAAFSGSPTSGTAPLTVSFTDASTGSPATRAWDFDGNGTVDSTLQNPTFTYTSAGTYTVSLTASNGFGADSEVKTGYVVVTAPPSPPPGPTAAFSGSPRSGQTPLTVAFTDQSSGSPTSWAWDFDGDGTLDSTSQNPSFTYNSAGTYTVTLTAANAHGSDPEVQPGYVVVSAPPAPTAAFSGSPGSGTAPLTVAFTDQSSGSPTSWAWDFDGNGIVDSTLPSPSFTYSNAGTYAVTLTVANASGFDSEVKTGYITVSEPAVAPTPEPPPQPAPPAPGTAPGARFTASPTQGVAPLLVRFADASSGAPTSWAWDFQDDGRVDSTEPSPTFTYATPGTFVARLTVANALGSNSAVAGVVVGQAPSKSVTSSLTAAADGHRGAPRARALRVGGARGRPHAYLMFGLGRVQRVITAASLRLYVTDTSSAPVTVRRCAAGWTERRLGDGYEPRLVGRVIGQARPLRRGRWLELRLPGGAIPRTGNLCLALLSTAKDAAAFGSRESRTPPTLVLKTN